MPVSRNAHQLQFAATPPVRTKLVTRFGVSVLNVVATIEMPTSHHGAARPDVKNSVVLELARRQKNSAGRNEMMIDSAMTTRSAVLRCMGRLRYGSRATFAPMPRHVLLLTGLVPALAGAQAPALPPVMPMPRSIELGQGRLRIDSGFSIAVLGYSDARLT